MDRKTRERKIQDVLRQLTRAYLRERNPRIYARLRKRATEIVDADIAAKLIGEMNAIEETNSERN
ncbi:MAG TPA: hypothetical protein VN577_16100 [Terriglobales bacterium]|nr:hypothetical protein [Terriglobales bacterium]